jgi:2-oxo-4-hydroxy-4-carboxy-5-ureidoimidazoline decarboxylase
MERWEAINAASPDAARAQLRICCGSSRWVERMMARLPFASREAARASAREEWFALSPADWREAFDHHPKIGERNANSLSAREQAGVAQAGDDVKGALLEGNREYEKRFGYIFIVCATGKPADEMLALLRARLKNDPATEIGIAAGEHAKICDLRLTGAVPSQDTGRSPSPSRRRPRR